MSDASERRAFVPLATLLATFPHAGRLEWIGLRPARRAPPLVPTEATLVAPGGLVGDRYAGRSGTREVTLVQAEHLPAIAGMLRPAGFGPPSPHADGRGADADAADGLAELGSRAAALRRNLVVSGLNLLALKGRRFGIGDAVLEHTGLCHPCSRMEETLGPGGYNAVRGHGGITARVVSGGVIRLGDAVRAIV